MRLQQYLTEKTFNVNADVDLIWKELFKPSYDLFKRGKYDEFMSFIEKQRYITSGELKSKQAKEAHKINPIDIFLVYDNDGNFYDPTRKLIHLSYNYGVLDIMKQFNYNSTHILRNVTMNKEVQDRFDNEVSEGAIKGTIYHEVSHWLNDTFHNKNISKLLIKAREEGNINQLKQGHSNVNLTFYELDAQVHALKQLKRTYKKEYDNFGYEDIIKYKSSFLGVFRAASRNKKEYDEFMKNFVKRLHREGLLTDKLKKIPSFNEMYRILSYL